MAFTGMLMVLILFTIWITGIILCLTGLVFLIIYLAKRKTKKKKTFLTAAIIFLAIGIPMVVVIGLLMMVNK